MLGKRPFIFLLFFVLGSLIYSNTLKSPFVFDDVPNITENASLRLTELSFSQAAQAAFRSYDPKRPVANLSFALNYYFHQYDVTGYHVVNVAVHILSGIFLYLFILVTLEVSAHKDKPSSVLWIALFASLIWFVHPVQTQSVTYIVQRMNSLSAMFYILSLLLYVHGRLSGAKNKILI